MSFIGYCEKAASGDIIGIPSVIAWAMINRSKGVTMMERQVYYLGQVIPQIDAEIAEKGHFRMETSWAGAPGLRRKMRPRRSWRS